MELYFGSSTEEIATGKEQQQVTPQVWGRNGKCIN
jgi:hypothetical protein